MEAFLPAFHDVFRSLAESGVPAVASVRGLCLGGAFELASFCSFVVAEKGSSFGVPEITLGVFPPIACLTLPWKIGGARAMEMILTGRHATAQEMKDWGLVNVLCGDGEAEAATEVSSAAPARDVAAGDAAVAAGRYLEAMAAYGRALRASRDQHAPGGSGPA